jgi:hypothetical protein
MAIKWNDLKHKSSPEIRANLKREADAELERIGFHKLRQARQQTQVAIAERLNIAQGAGICRRSRRPTGVASGVPGWGLRYRDLGANDVD